MVMHYADLSGSGWHVEHHEQRVVCRNTAGRSVVNTVRGEMEIALRSNEDCHRIPWLEVLHERHLVCLESDRT